MKFLTIYDIDENEIIVNMDYIVLLEPREWSVFDNCGRKTGTRTRFFVYVASADVAVYNARRIEVCFETYKHIIRYIKADIPC